MKKTLGSKIATIIYIIVILIIFYGLFRVFKIYNYNEFIKAQYNLGNTSFTRDNNVKYSYDYSYKMQSKEYNDAIFYKTIKVKPNTPYKLSCMVKTENVEVENNKNGAGAQISLVNTTECSKSITGTNDWQKLELIFDSKNRDSVDIGFRLGGNEANCKGTAWFSDFKLEQGTKDNNSNWNVACFIIKNLDLNIDNTDVEISMNLNNIEAVKSNMERFKNAANELSNNKMTVTYDIFEIDKPATSITYSEEYGYYLDPLDIEPLIEEYLSAEEYDYIFVATKLGDANKNIELPVYDWIGLRRNGFTWNWILRYTTSK